MPTLCIVLANSVCNTHRSGIDIVPSRQGRNLIVPCTAAFLRQRKGVAAGVATRTECHVNGRGTTTRPQTQRLGLRLDIVAGANSRAMSIDVALSTCCDVRSNAY